jgi:metal-responsive CopG/Arc/MetJ family transcriptional regulator
MSTRTIKISLPPELVKELDMQVKRDFSSRAEYMRKAIVNQLRGEQALTELCLTEPTKKAKSSALQASNKLTPS